MSLIKKLAKSSLYSLYIKYKLKKLQKASLKLIKEYVNSNPIKKLHIGAGGNTLDGCLNTDPCPENRQTTFLDASESFSITDETFYYIFSEHVLSTSILLNRRICRLKVIGY